MEALKRSRGSIKAKLTIFKTHLNSLKTNLTTLQFNELNVRFRKIQDLYDEFDTVQTQIEQICEIPEDEQKERENFESGYFVAIAVAQELIDTYAVEAGSAASERSGASVTGSGTAIHAGGPNVKLPTIQIPTFSGRYQDWLEFHDTYKSLVHTNTTISDIHKFHYLRASLKDSASLIIQSLEFSAENYQIAWALLCERYNNDRILINNHVQALFGIDQITKESSKALRNLIDIINKNLRALKTLKLPTEHWDVLIIHLVSTKLDAITFREWETQRNLMKPIPNLDDFNTFLKHRADLLETMEETQLNSTRKHIDTHKQSKTFIANQTTIKQYTCPICKHPHSIYQCYKFKAMPIEARIQKIKQINLCTNCLRAGHDEKRCRMGPCRLCSQRHNTMLHIDYKTTKLTQEPIASTSRDCVVLPTLQNQEKAESKSQNTHASRTQQNDNITLSTTHSSQVLLSTAIINIQDRYGQLHTIRCLLDNGSTSSFITESTQKSLQIPSYSTSISVQGLNQQSSKITQRCDVSISSLSNSGYTADVNCFVVPQITQLIPTTKISCDLLGIPHNITLADPTFNEPSEVQMLLGADLFWEVMLNNKITLGNNKPTLVETTLGWLVTGSILQTNTKNTYNTVHCHHLNNTELDEQLNRFFELESISTTQSSRTKGDVECDDIFTSTTVRQSDGRFVVTIPFKESPQCLGDSKEQALTRFHSLEKKFKRNPIFKQQYTQFMDEYKSLNHMSENLNPDSDEISYFLPHHGIQRVSDLQITSKFRSVFDGSAVTSSGKSLNDIQYKGPTVQDDLLSILIRFRQHKFVVTSDIEKMYRQILINENQRSLQQIFWRSDPEQEIKQYKLHTVTYGTKSAPYLATRCIYELGQNSKDKKVSETILHDFYVDDLITGSDDELTLINTCKGIIQQLESAHFHLRKWKSNIQSILNKIVDENSSNDLLNLGRDQFSKTLGLLWACQKDTLIFSQQKLFTQNQNLNKRTILSTMAQVFDPLGLINPCMLQAKLILQTLWSKNISWDEKLPTDIELQWNNFMQHIPELTTIQIPRRVLCDSFNKVELHAFSDGSMKAYSACVFARSIASNGDVTVRLILAKGKVTPLKQKLTIPKIELCGALLATQLANKIVESMRIQFDSLFYWCDSTIVLGWIKMSNKQQLKQFVYNRIHDIIKNSDPCSWHYVPTDMNPADIGSRGLTISQLKNSFLWWAGPHFLHQTVIQWPMQPQETKIENLPEIKLQCHTYLIKDDNFTNSFSNFGKLLRITIYIKRFIYNCRNPLHKKLGTLKSSEFDSATKTLCKVVQIDLFTKQYIILTKKQHLPTKDKLLNLNPFVDDMTQV